MRGPPINAELSVADTRHVIVESSLEWKLCDPEAFGLTTASPLQRAICRAADGRPMGADLHTNPHVRAAFGGTFPEVGVVPRELAIISGVRTGKSLLAAALAVHWSQRIDTSSISSGETPRISILSLTKDQADVVLDHLVSRLQESIILRHLIVGKPTADGIHLRQPNSRHGPGVVEVKVVAGARAGGTLVARWSAGVIFDEFPRMRGADEAVVNWEHERHAVQFRLLPGAQMAHIGSPWAPEGPAYELVTSRHGKPGKDLVVVRAPAWDMNPVYWHPIRVEQARTEVEAFHTDVAGEFATPAENLFGAEVLSRACRETPEVLPPESGLTYAAAIDPATRGNGWTLVIATRRGGRKLVVGGWEWRGTREAPLSPRDILEQIKDICSEYRIHAIDTDTYYGDALQDIARGVGLTLVAWPLTTHELARRYMGIKTLFDNGTVELPPNRALRTDLARVRKTVRAGGITLQLPHTSDGRHCDYAPSVMLVLSRYLEGVQPTSEKENPDVVSMRKRAQEKYGRGSSIRW